jgi:hypothetical protein
MLAAVAALASSCSSTPKTYGPCHHVVVYPPHNKGGYVAAYDWDDDVHAYGEAVPFTACFSFGESTAVAEGPPGVTIDPTEQPIGHGEFGVITFTVTVTKGSAGPIWVRLQESDGRLFSRPPGPVITPADGGWRFTSPDRS